MNQLAKKTQLPLKLAFNTVRGYFIQMHLPKKSSYGPYDLFSGSKRSLSKEDEKQAKNVKSKRFNLPKECVKIVKLNNLIQFTTDFMIKSNDRITECIEDIYIMSNR